MSARSTRRNRSRHTGVVMLIAVLIFGGGIFIGWRFLHHTAQPLTTLSSPFPEDGQRPSETEATNILVAGSISRQDGEKLEENLAERAQTLTLFHLPESQRSAQIVTIDPSLSAPDGGTLGASATDGTTADLVATVENTLDTRIDHVVLMDYTGLIDTADSLGGLTDSDGSELSPEKVKELLAEQQDGDAPTTIDPATNEQLLHATLYSVMTEAAKDPGSLATLGETLGDRTAANSELNSRELISLGRTMRSIPSSAMTWCTLDDDAAIPDYQQMFAEDTLATCND